MSIEMEWLEKENLALLNENTRLKKLNLELQSQYDIIKYKNEELNDKYSDFEYQAIDILDDVLNALDCSQHESIVSEIEGLIDNIENLTSENIDLKTRLELEKQAESEIYHKYKSLLK
jgi:hypothetical protein